MKQFTKERQMTLIFRWALLTGGFFALVWTVCYFVTGSVPVIYSISRWWDVLMGPICSAVFIVIFGSTEERPMEPEEFCMVGLSSGLAIGLLIGLFCGLFYGLFLGLALGLALGLVIGLLGRVVALIGFVVLTSKGVRKQCADWIMARNKTPTPISIFVNNKH